MKPIQKRLLAIVSALAVSASSPLSANDGVDEQIVQEQTESEAQTETGSVAQSIFQEDSNEVDVQVVSHLCEESCDVSPSEGCDTAGEDHSFFNFKKRLHTGSNCLPPWWSHRTGASAEYLWLRPGSSDIIYATEQTDPDPTIASPTGPIGMVNIDAESGFRVGFTLAETQCTSLVTRYARWDGSSSSTLDATGANVLGSNLIHPSTATSGAASLQSYAEQEISFQTLDVMYRRLWKHSDTMALNWIAGLRYGNIEQQLSGDQTISVATGLTNVSTDIDFDGFGIGGGLDFETYSCRTGLSLYGSALGSLLAGEWNATYTQTNQFGGGVVANEYEDFHATPVLEAELGIRWMAPKRHLMVSTGFLMSGWYESVTTRGYIDAVRAGQLTDTGETMTFSGLTAGAEWRF